MLQNFLDVIYAHRGIFPYDFVWGYGDSGVMT